MKLYGVVNSAQRPEVRKKISENCEGFDEKRKATMMERYGVVNPMDSEELRDRNRQTIQDRYGVDNISQVESFQAKKRETSLERYGNEQFLGSDVGRVKVHQGVVDKYGVDNVFQLEEVKLKIRQTNLENLGVEMPTQCKEVMDKIEQTNIERYGCKNPAQNEQVKEKTVSTNLDRYGCKNPTQNEQVKKKIVATNLDRYGFRSPQQSPEIKAKVRQNAIDSGRIKLHDGKDLTTLAKEFEIPYSTLVHHTALYGVDLAIQMTPQISSLEKVIQSWLDEEKVNYKLHYRAGGRISDFWLSDTKIIIELDGLYWHSDIHRPDDYHIVKRDTYIENGYTPLFFREDEVNNKLPIVKSIIMNKLGRSTRMFARKCTIVEVSRAESALFFETNHLMGKGRGTTYGLKYGDEIISCIVIRNTRGNDYEISRFCHKLGYQVVGGLSKLITHFTRNNNVNTLTTFIDNRYGDGEYLTKLGFSFIGCSPSFRWTNTVDCLHRMKFPGNTGYDNGFVKIWDCGQARYDLYVQS
jgi:very-short-patch-repair endonuclease